MYEKRVYRNLFRGEDLVFFDVCLFETDLCIGAHKNLYSEAYELVRHYRSILETYIDENPEFITSLKPLKAKPGAPLMITRMCEAAHRAKVGPMAAVAGAIAELVGFELLKFSDEIIVENGGDIFIKTNTIRRVGIYAGKSPLSERIALEIDPVKTPIGICTSSGTVGHSLSYGKADAAIITAGDTFLADAAATALGNAVKSPYDLEAAINMASEIEGVDGALAIIGDKMAIWGDIRLCK